jgi:MerR family copper efflux transcriptional regulator
MPTNTQTRLLRIGELSEQSDFPIKTLRYYEELGLIQAQKRTQGGFASFRLIA